jgi:hypothetical protein
VVVGALGEVYIHADHCRRNATEGQPGDAEGESLAADSSFIEPRTLRHFRRTGESDEDLSSGCSS